MTGTRDLSGDPAALFALAHPVRLAVLELLGEDGPLTATEAGRRLGQAPGNMSWHLRVLAQHGFVQEAAGSGRRRPWRLTASGYRWDLSTTAKAERAASDALVRTVLKRSIGQLEAWLAAARTAAPRWQQASDVSDWTLYLTAAETAQLREDLHRRFEPYLRRLSEPALRPRGSRQVKAFLALFPALPLPKG